MDISFNCDKCGQPIVVDEVGVGASVRYDAAEFNQTTEILVYGTAVRIKKV
jgi:hypothetical protein